MKNGVWNRCGTLFGPSRTAKRFLEPFLQSSRKRFLEPFLQRRGFVLWMFMIVLMLLGVFSLIAGRLMTASFRVSQNSQEAQTQVMRFDAMLNRLRADVWNSRSINASAGRLELIEGNGASVVWQAAEKSVTRVAGTDHAQWANLGAELRFERRGAMVVAKLNEGPIKRSDEVAMVSQAMMLGRGER